MSQQSSEVVEVGGPAENPERYQRYKKCLGKGAFKTVYEAFDTEHTNLVAWNQVERGNLEGAKYAEFLREVTTLERLDHPNIIKMTDWWESEDKSNVVFITELMTSGDLKKFIRSKKVPIRTTKKWARQILQALDYIHTKFENPIVHRDIKCDNIFINGNLGEVKLGDLGLSTTMTQTHAASVLGTPEFMAPEMYGESYNHKVDIYAFGMCILEIYTGQYPYSECTNTGQIFTKVAKGLPPRALVQMENVCVKHFIETCLLPVEKRPTARELLDHALLIDLEAAESAPAVPATAPVVSTESAGTPTMSSNDAAGADHSVPAMPDNSTHHTVPAMHDNATLARAGMATSTSAEAGSAVVTEIAPSSSQDRVGVSKRVTIIRSSLVLEKVGEEETEETKMNIEAQIDGFRAPLPLSATPMLVAMPMDSDPPCAHVVESNPDGTLYRKTEEDPI